MTVTELTDTCDQFDVIELTVTELTCHQYGLSLIWLAPIYHRRPIFIYRRAILKCSKATWKMANYRRPHSTYYRPILRGGKAT